MNPRVLLTTLCIVWLFLLSWQSLLCPQEKPGKAKPNPIEGEWTEVIREMAGVPQSMLPDLQPAMPGRMGLSSPYRWKISNKTIEMGQDMEYGFPKYRYIYKLSPGKQEDAIDLNLDAVDLYIVDEARRGKLNDKQKETQRAIFFVKGDYLIICNGGDTRPRSLTSSKDNPNTVHVLRRGKLYNTNDRDTAKPKR